MSRSYKKVAGGGIALGRSDKWYKTNEHRRYRAVVRNLLASYEEECFPEYSGKYGDPYRSPKDGKTVWYWTAQSFLKTEIYNKIREEWCTNPDHPVHMCYKPVSRPATIDDWKRDWIGK